MNEDFNDSLDRLFAGDIGPVGELPVREIPTYKTAVERFEEGCPKCKGSGRFVSYSGRVLGQCFACKGAGKKVFKTSTATREQNRERNAMKKQETATHAMDAFAADHPAEFAWLEVTATRWDVAASLLEGVRKYGSLTEKQMTLVHNGMARDAARSAAKKVAGPAVDVSAIERAFATAREKAQRPGQMGVMVKPLKLAAGPTKEDIAFKVSPGSLGSRWEGDIFFKSIDGERKLGYVKDGRFNRQFACTDAEAAAIVTVASDPKQGLIAFAKAWSRCGVCGRGLLNDESIERGIGPICFAKFGFD